MTIWPAGVGSIPVDALDLSHIRLVRFYIVTVRGTFPDTTWLIGLFEDGLVWLELRHDDARRISSSRNFCRLPYFPSRTGSSRVLFQQNQPQRKFGGGGLPHSAQDHRSWNSSGLDQDMIRPGLQYNSDGFAKEKK